MRKGVRPIDPRRPFAGETVAYDEHGIAPAPDILRPQPARASWLPVSEPAFLLWVLVALMLIWLGVGVAPPLT